MEHTGKISQAKILIIDDEEAIRDSCSQIIRKDGHVAETAEDGSKGLEKIRKVSPDMALIDLKMPGINGIDVLRQVKEINPNIIPVVITGYASIESAVEAMKIGAYDYLPKPFAPGQLRMIIKRGLERRRLILEAESLREEKKLMEEAFITMVSHQLRSPLVAIQQYFEVILGGMAGPVEEKQKHMLLRARDRMESLLSLINDWLDMARIDKGYLVERFQTFSAEDLLRELVEFMQPLANKSEVSLKLTEVSGDTTVNGDKETLEQVFSNLITNAIKYNRPNGSIDIRIDEADKDVRVEIKDSGIGIAKENLPFIFDQFYRVNRKEGQKTNGTGLGLSIAKKIVEAHNGSIHVSSELGKRTTFCVLLPKGEKNEKI
jgi:signal transduction histidine kinase